MAHSPVVAGEFRPRGHQPWSTAMVQDHLRETQ